MIGVEVHEPQLRLVGYAHVCSLRRIRLRISRHVAFAHRRQWHHVARLVATTRIPGCHQYSGTSRVTSGGKGPCVMAVFTVSRHFTATLGAPRPRRSERNGNSSPTRTASSSRWRRGVLWLCRPIHCSRAKHMRRSSCAHTRMSSAAASSAVPMIKEFRKRQNKLVQTLRLNRDTTKIHSTDEGTKMEHSESIFSESRSSQRTLTRVPKVTTESHPF